MSLSFALKPTKKSTEDSNKKQITMDNIFNCDDDEEEEPVALPKNAKTSKNIGRDTITSQGPNSFGKHRNLGFTNDNSFRPWATDIELKHHKLSRPLNEYLNDKIEEEEQQRVEREKQFLQEKSLLEKKQEEFKKIKERIKMEKNKIKICLVCKRKFTNMQDLNNHELNSQLHQENMLRQ